MESYQVLVMSTAHLTERDTKILSALADSKSLTHDSMIMEREEGYLLKLYSPVDSQAKAANEREGSFSAELIRIIMFATDKGYRMVEFDRDAETIDMFPVFDW